MRLISFDTNILAHAANESSPDHHSSRAFLLGLRERDDVAVSEFVLTELYGLLRNPAVLPNPLSAGAAVKYIQLFRGHPLWQVIGFPSESKAIHNEIWRQAGQGNFSRRRIYDVRFALCLRHFGVTDFATVNLKDFRNLGFERVWNPLR